MDREGFNMADLRINLAGIAVTQSVLVGIGATDEHGLSGSARVRSGLGWSGVENTR